MLGHPYCICKGKRSSYLSKCQYINLIRHETVIPELHATYSFTAYIRVDKNGMSQFQWTLSFHFDNRANALVTGSFETYYQDTKPVHVYTGLRQLISW